MFFAGLPDWCRSKSKLEMDEETAKLRAEQIPDEDIEKISEERANKANKKPEIGPRGYTNVIEKLNQAIDAINLLRLTVRQVGGGKVKETDFTPEPRPTTALQREINKRVEQYEEEYQRQAMAEFGF